MKFKRQIKNKFEFIGMLQRAKHYLINNTVSNNMSEATTTSPNTSVAKWTKTANFTFLSTKLCSLEWLPSKSGVRQTTACSKSYRRFF
jgi:hypothetical protein